MNRVLALIGCVALLQSSLAQIDIELSAGYAFDLTPLRVSEYTAIYDPSGYMESEESVTIGFYKGIASQLGINLRRSNGIFLNAGAAFNIGNQSIRIGHEEENYMSGDQETYSETYQLNYTMVHSQLGVGIEQPINDKLSFSITSGLTAVVSNTTNWTYEEEYTSTFSSSSSSTLIQNIKEKGALTMGMFSSLKLNYALTDKLSLFFNTTFRSASYIQRSSVMDRYEVNGKDELGSLEVEDKETIYETEYSYDPMNWQAWQGKPSRTLASRFTNSGVALLLGVRYSLYQEESQATELTHNISFTAYGGYNLPMNGTNTNEANQTSSTNVDRDADHVTFAKGITYGVTSELSLSGALSAELGINYVSGAYEEQIYYFHQTGSFTHSYKTNREFTGKMLRIMPGARLSSSSGKFDIYTRFGASIGIATESNYRDTYTQDNVDSSDPSNSWTTFNVIEYKYTGKPSIGVYMGLGVAYNITDKLAINIDATGILQSFTPTRRVKTEDNYNGTDQLPWQSTRNKEVIYVDSYTEDQYTQHDPDEPATRVYELDQSFSAQMISLGLSFKIGK